MLIKQTSNLFLFVCIDVRFSRKDISMDSNYKGVSGVNGKENKNTWPLFEALLRMKKTMIVESYILK